MAMHIEYLDDPGPTPPRLPFRCARCRNVNHTAGQWVHRWEGVPGHFMAVCGAGSGCAAPPRYKRWFSR